jgi:hypothetical protein
MFRGLGRKISPAVWLFSSSLAACPICNSETGEAVRAGIENNFGFNFLAAMSPFGVILILILAATGGPRAFLGENHVSKSE